MTTHESARLDALRSYEILDTPAEADFDDLVHLASCICETPMAAVSLVDAERQWFKAEVGLACRQTARDISFCTHGIEHEREMFVIPDAHLDDRFARSPLVVAKPHIRFYAGARLSNVDGHALGMLCVMDREPRRLTGRQQEALQILARQVVAQMELRRELAAHRQSRELIEKSRRDLRDSEALYHSLVEHLPLLLLRKDRDSRFTFANKLFCEALGCPLDELIGKTDFDLLPKEMAEKIRADDQRVLTLGKPLERIQEVSRPGGQTLHMQIITSPLRDQHGKIVGVQVISMDVTEKHRLESQLRQSHDELERSVRARTAQLQAANEALTTAEQQASEWKERYDLVVASSGLAVYDIDRISREVVWGSGAERVLGVEPTALHRASDEWLEMVHPQDRATVTRGIEAAMTTGQSFDMQYRLRNGTDYYRWIQDRGFVAPDAQGRCLRLLGVMQDVTQRKLAEDTMREQAALLDQTQDAIMVRDLENHVLYWNQTAQRQYGWTVGEALGKPIQDLLLRGDLAHLPTAQAIALKQGSWSGEVKAYTKAGKELTIHSRWSLLCDRDHKPHSFLVAHTDLTAQKVLEAKFLRAQRLESLGALASGIAHDLNNVFTPILMSAQLLSGELNDTTRANMLRILSASARRGSDMVKQVLTFTRGLSAGPGLVHLKHLIAELERMMRDTFPRNIRIESNVRSDLWLVRGDATQLYQVLMNLCINSRDAMPDGGVLKLEASNLEFDPGQRGTEPTAKRGPSVCITVADSGTGMTPEVRQRIFEPFFTTKEIGKGTGLGLSTTMTLVKAHGGSIEVESEVGAGTQFKILIPAENTQSMESAAATEETPRGNGELLLVVEDESAIREILKTTLEAHDYDVLLAEEGTEALALYATHRDKIALVITDIAMPVLDGHGTIRALRKMNTGLKFIATSGLMDAGKLDQSSGSGITVLTKPYSPDSLLNAVHDVLHPSDH